MQYLLDTNICIYIIRRRPPEVVARFRECSLYDIAISTITLFELQYGAEKSQHRESSLNAIRNFLLPFKNVDVDRPAAESAANIRAQLERQGTPIGPYDLLIAGIALSRQLTLITNNIREFSRIEGLYVENWANGSSFS